MLITSAFFIFFQKKVRKRFANSEKVRTFASAFGKIRGIEGVL
jgi:hypothetical protein